MQEINLLQNRVKDTTHVWEKQSKLMLTLLSLILIIILGGTGVLYFLNQSLEKQISVVAEDNVTLNKQLTEEQKDLGSAKTFQAQLANLRVLIANHSYLSPLLDELTKTTYKQARYINLDVADSGKIHVEGGVGTYSDLGKLLLGLSTSTKFQNVKLLSAVPSSGITNSYIFSVDMNVSPDIFFKQ